MRNADTLRATVAIWLPIVILAATLGCGRSSPSSPSPSVLAAAAAAPPAVSYHVAGVVVDETGSAVAGAGVNVDYAVEPGRASFCCSVYKLADGAGNYDLAFGPGGLWMQGLDGAGLISAFRDGYETDIQVLPKGAADIVKNLRLRRVRTIHPGQSITVSIDPDSALCSDLEDLWLLTSRCENVEIVAEQAGTLVIEARAKETGAAVPSIFFATSGRYTSAQVRGPATASVGILPGGRYRVYVGIPSGTASQRYDVSASLR